MAFYFAGNVVDQNLVPVVGAKIYIFANGEIANVIDANGDAAPNPLTSGADGFYEGRSEDVGVFRADIYWGGRLRFVRELSNEGRIQELTEAAEVAAQIAAAISGPLYGTTEAGLTGTVDGDEFIVDNGDGTGTIYINDDSNATLIRVVVLDPAAPGAAALIGVDGGGTVQDALDALAARVTALEA